MPIPWHIQRKLLKLHKIEKELLKTKIKVLEARKSAKNPKRGTARLEHTVTNQNNEIVMTWISNQMLRTKS